MWIKIKVRQLIFTLLLEPFKICALDNLLRVVLNLQEGVSARDYCTWLLRVPNWGLTVEVSGK